MGPAQRSPTNSVTLKKLVGLHSACPIRIKVILKFRSHRWLGLRVTGRHWDAFGVYRRGRPL